MVFVDCYWELENIGKRTCEISYEEGETFDEVDFLNKTQGFEYIVVKVPMSQLSINLGLAKLGFVMMETQINISKNYQQFNFEDRLIRILYPHVEEQIVTSGSDFNRILSKITPNMFSTDRIYLDSYFNNDISRKRYTNWMKTEFQNKTSIFKKIIYNGEDVGFGMLREKNGIIHGLLGGVYELKQSEGIGFLTACSGFLTAHKNNTPFKKVVTAISSNNIAMLQIYNYLQFKVDKMTYVFVKHK